MGLGEGLGEGKGEGTIDTMDMENRDPNDINDHLKVRS